MTFPLSPPVLTPSLKLVLTLALLGAVRPACAQLQPASPQDTSAASSIVVPSLASAAPIRSIELDVGGEELTNGYGNWTNETLFGTYQVDQQVLQVELSAKEEFRSSGTYLGLADTITIDQDWFTRLSIGTGDGAFYLPRVRGDAFLSRKWLDQRNLITSIGVGYYEAPDGHIDRSLSFGSTYYFSTPWILEGGLRFNRSDPGSISTHQQFLAVTYGHEKQDVLTLRYGWGGEGYQEIAGNVSLVNFQSHEASIAWRHWLNANLGLLAKVDNYSNPYYQRKGANVGLFYQF